MGTAAIFPIDRGSIPRRPRAPGRLLAVLGMLAVAGCADLWPVRGADGNPMPSTYETQLTQGRRHLAAGHDGLAIAAFRAAVDRNPNSVEALNGLAAAYDRIGWYNLAAHHYKRALAVDPGSAQTLNNVGFSYMLQGKFDLATVYLRDAQQRDQSDPAIAANRAVAEAALQASRPRPDAQWQAPSDKDVRPLPRAWLERTTPVVQTLVTRPILSLASAEVVDDGPYFRPARQPHADTLPGMVAAPIGDTRMSADHDRLSRPIAATMTDAWVVNLPTVARGDEDDEAPG